MAETQRYAFFRSSNKKRFACVPAATATDCNEWRQAIHLNPPYWHFHHFKALVNEVNDDQVTPYLAELNVADVG